MNCLKIKLLLFIAPLVILFGCNVNEKKLVTYAGFTQGTTFSIKFYASNDSTKLKQGIDTILYAINYTASVYDTNSVISKVNSNRHVDLNNDFIALFHKSTEVSIATNGCFDITVGELVRAWGFGFKRKEDLTQEKVDSLLKYLGYYNISIENNRVIKKFPETKIDFNAIAQGYTVDLVSEYLLKNACTDFLVEIGGEIRANGSKQNKEKWIVGIEQPAPDENAAQIIQEKVTLFNKSISTSGNYRKFFIKDGVKYSHTIDPKTGYPVHHSLLSVSVIANDCATADAYATAFMVMGVEKAKTFLLKNPGLEAYFIYHDSINGNQVYFTNKFFMQDK